MSKTQNTSYKAKIVAIIILSVLLLAIITYFVYGSINESKDMHQNDIEKIDETIDRTIEMFKYPYTQGDERQEQIYNSLKDNIWKIENDIYMGFGSDSTPSAFIGFFDSDHTSVSAEEGYTYTLWTSDEDENMITILSPDKANSVTYSIDITDYGIVFTHTGTEVEIVLK